MKKMWVYPWQHLSSGYSRFLDEYSAVINLARLPSSGVKFAKLLVAIDIPCTRSRTLPQSLARELYPFDTTHFEAIYSRTLVKACLQYKQIIVRWYSRSRPETLVPY